ncbi:Arm DNA-binding domain-containing protein [Falsihalocynthiibacter sp. S25ZX9]|uniref:Arm DNA-binding domain-containing protein n=1 Tax=Falsihalocynthiibacter sp. S25ZX9 TaxID=3240870 RepID=UPI0035106F72
MCFCSDVYKSKVMYRRRARADVTQIPADLARSQYSCLPLYSMFRLILRNSAFRWGTFWGILRMPQKNLRRPEKALSPRFVETVNKPGKYFDGQGLFLCVAKNGARQWVQRITIRRKRCEIGLGSLPAVSLATVRKLAFKNRGKAMPRGNPLADKRKTRKVFTFAEAGFGGHRTGCVARSGTDLA